MKKIPSNFEHPLENCILDICMSLNPTFIRCGITPNMLTTIGNVFRIGSIWALLQGYNWIFFILAILGWFMDCADGNLARASKNCSKFGDYYDHFSDVIYHGILLYILYNSNILSNFDSQTKYIIIGSMLILLYLSLTHVGCRQRWYVEKESSLNVLKTLCPDKNMIKYTRYFGFATTLLLGYLFIAIYY